MEMPNVSWIWFQWLRRPEPIFQVKVAAFGLSVLALAACGGPSDQAASAPPAAVPDEDAVLEILKDLHEAQDLYFRRHRRYALGYEELTGDFVLGEEPAPASVTGYEVRMRPAPDAASYRITATPAIPSSAARHFFTDQSGDIRAEEGVDASADSPVVSQPDR